jgi:hypothetical protein
LGVKPEASVGPEGTWDREINKTIALNKKMKSKMLMKKNGSININSNGDLKKIIIGAGEPNNPDSAINVDNEKIGLLSGKNGIRIDKDSHIYITTKSNNKDIKLDAGTGSVNIKGSQVDVAGSAFTKDSVAVLKSLKVIK